MTEFNKKVSNSEKSKVFPYNAFDLVIREIVELFQDIQQYPGCFKLWLDPERIGKLLIRQDPFLHESGYNLPQPFFGVG